MTQRPTEKPGHHRYNQGMNNNDTQSIVSRCDATACRFNSDQKCTAGQIEVSMSANQAQCLTFSPRADAQGQQPSAQQ